MTAPQYIRQLAYCSMVHSQVEYTASAWSPWLLHDISRLEGLQRRSTRFVLKNYQQTASVSNMIVTLRQTIECIKLLMTLYHYPLPQ